eukprot:6589084-Ditylum_brightwellii.AAC.1
MATTVDASNKMNGGEGDNDVSSHKENGAKASKVVLPSSQLPEKSQEEGSIEYTCLSSLPMPPLSSFSKRRGGIHRLGSRRIGITAGGGAHVTQQDENDTEYDDDGKFGESQVVWYPERTQQQH